MQRTPMGLLALTVLVEGLVFGAESAKTQRVTFAVDAKGEWAGKAKAAVGKVDGVVKSDIKDKDKHVRVEYQPVKVTPQKLARALADAGIHARLLLHVDGMS